MSDEKSYAIGYAKQQDMLRLNTGPWTIHDDNGNPHTYGEPIINNTGTDNIAVGISDTLAYGEYRAGYVLPLGWKREA